MRTTLRLEMPGSDPHHRHAHSHGHEHERGPGHQQDPSAGAAGAQPGIGSVADCANEAPRADGGSAAIAGAIRRVFVLTLILNLAVAITKAAYAYVSGSLALGTDSIHAFLDGSSNVLALLSLHWSGAPADAKHPYGHRKIEILAAMGIGVLIVISLFEMSSVAVHSLIGGQRPPQVGLGGFAVVLGCMVVNVFVTRYEHSRGHLLGSPLLCADAQHTLSDLYASAAVVATFLGARAGWWWADPVGAMVVVVLVGRAAWVVFRDNIPTLIDAAVLDPVQVIDCAKTVSGIRGVARVRSRGLPRAVQLDLHVAVDPHLTIKEAHELAHEVELRLRSEYPELSDVVIHTTPSDRDS